MQGEQGTTPLKAATAAFVEALRAAEEAGLVTRKQIAAILDVAQSTICNWLVNERPPNLLHAHRSTMMSVNKRLYELEDACGAQRGELVSLYGAVERARRQKDHSRQVLPALDSYLGVNRLHRSFPAYAFGELVAKAAAVRMLNTWFPNLRELERPLRQALRAGCVIEMMLLNPVCTAAITRASALGYPPGRGSTYSIAGEVEESLGILNDLVAECEDSDQLRVFLYPEIPALAIYQADDYILAGLFLHGRLAVDGPQLEIQCAGSFMSDVVSQELEKVAALCMGPIPLARWKEWLNEQL